MNAPVLLLDARDVVAGYLPGVDILNGCSLTVNDGEIIGIIGPNGAGKSTLVKVLFGLVPLRGGSVHLRGEDTTRKPPHELVKRGVGYVPQLHNVFPSLTVEDNLRMGCYLRPDIYREREAAMLEVLPRLGERLELPSGVERPVVGGHQVALMGAPELGFEARRDQVTEIAPRQAGADGPPVDCEDRAHRVRRRWEEQVVDAEVVVQQAVVVGAPGEPSSEGLRVRLEDARLLGVEREPLDEARRQVADDGLQ